jgi:phage-related minor tail protein
MADDEKGTSTRGALKPLVAAMAVMAVACAALSSVAVGIARGAVAGLALACAWCVASTACCAVVLGQWLRVLRDRRGR